MGNLKTTHTGDGWYTVSRRHTQPSKAGWRRQHSSFPRVFSQHKQYNEWRQRGHDTFPRHLTRRPQHRFANNTQARRSQHQKHFNSTTAPSTGQFSFNGSYHYSRRLPHQQDVKEFNGIGTIASLFPSIPPPNINGARPFPTTKDNSDLHQNFTINSFQPPATENLMAKRKSNNFPSPYVHLMQSHAAIPTTHLSPNTSITPPALSFSQAVHSPYQSRLPISTQRYQYPPWRHFLDLNPWDPSSIKASTATASTQPGSPPSPNPLPLPPDPNLKEWRGRCYNCLHLGHSQQECTSDERVCALCWKKGHEAKSCSRASNQTRFDPLIPRGNLGEEELPKNRPKVVNVFIPETQQMRHDALDLNRAIVIDARLRPANTTHILQSVLMSTCRSDYPYPITHMSGQQYLLLLPIGMDRHKFLLNFGKPLQELGYVAFPWSAAVNGYPMSLKYKVWVELKKLAPQAWCIDYLIAAVSSFGIVLDHSSLTKSPSLESMMAVVAIPELSDIPLALRMWIRGIARDIELKVHSWIEESVPLSLPVDTTPTEKFFKKVKLDNARAIAGHQGITEGNGVTIEFETLYNIWVNLPTGIEKDDLGGTLRANPKFETHHQQAQPAAATKPLPATDPKWKGKGKAFPEQMEGPVRSKKRGSKTKSFSLDTASKIVPSTLVIQQSNSGTHEMTLVRENIQNSNLNLVSEIQLSKAQVPTFNSTISLSPIHAENTNLNPILIQSPTSQPDLVIEFSPTQIINSILDQANQTAQAFEHSQPKPIEPVNPHPPSPHPNSLVSDSHLTEPRLSDSLIETEQSTELGRNEPDPMEEEPFEEPEEELEEVEPVEQGKESEPVIGFSSNLIFESYDEDLDVDDYLEAEYHSSLLAETGQLDQTGSNLQEGDFDDEINKLQLELDEQERMRDEEEAYLSALADRANMEVVQGEAEIPQVAVEQEEAPPPIPQPIEPESQQNLRRSARISVRGATKRYNNTKPRVKKTTKEGNVTMNPERQAALLMALRNEVIAPNPLQQQQADLVDQYCGLKEVAMGFITNVASGSGLGRRVLDPSATGAAIGQAEEGNWDPASTNQESGASASLVNVGGTLNESVLDGFEYDSADDFSDEKNHYSPAN